MARFGGQMQVANTSAVFGDVLNLLSSGVIFIGGAVCIFGIVQLGLAVKDGSTGGGGQLAGAIAMIAGGAIVAAAGIIFKTLDTSWVK